MWRISKAEACCILSGTLLNPPSRRKHNKAQLAPRNHNKAQPAPRNHIKAQRAPRDHNKAQLSF